MITTLRLSSDRDDRPLTKPVKPLPPFMRFIVEQRKNNPALAEMHFSQLLSLLGPEWRKLSPAVKKEYTKKTIEDKVRYREDIAAYKKELAERNYIEKVPETRRVAPNVCALQAFRLVLTSLAAPSKDPRSGWALFCKDHFDRVYGDLLRVETAERDMKAAFAEAPERFSDCRPKEALPNQAEAGIANNGRCVQAAGKALKILAKEYKSLSQKEKDAYAERRNALLEAHNKKMIDWWQSLTDDQQARVKRAWMDVLLSRSVWTRKHVRKQPEPELVDMFGEQKAAELTHLQTRTNKKTNRLHMVPWRCIKDLLKKDEVNDDTISPPKKERSKKKKKKEENFAAEED